MSVQQDQPAITRAARWTGPGWVKPAVPVTAVTEAVPMAPADAARLVAAAGAVVPGTPVKALSWNDRNGRNYALVTHELVRDGRGSVIKDVMHVVVVAQLGKTLAQLGRFVDKTTGLDLDLFQIHDGDHDGLGEIVICFVTKVVGKLVPVTMTVHRLIGGHDHVVHGTGLPEATVAGLSPTELLAVPTSLLAPVVSAVPAAGGQQAATTSPSPW